MSCEIQLERSYLTYTVNQASHRCIARQTGGLTLLTVAHQSSVFFYIAFNIQRYIFMTAVSALSWCTLIVAVV
jgi:hypothetical protein